MTCGGCGTRRFVDYRALGLALELPERLPPCGSAVGSARLRRPTGSTSPLASLTSSATVVRRTVFGVSAAAQAGT